MNDCDGYLVALYLDYVQGNMHFLRQDSREPEEKWSGKRGSGRVDDRDNNNNPIVDPKLAKLSYWNMDFDVYGDPIRYDYKFVGYFIAPKGGLGSEE